MDRATSLLMRSLACALATVGSLACDPTDAAPDADLELDARTPRDAPAAGETGPATDGGEDAASSSEAPDASRSDAGSSVVEGPLVVGGRRPVDVQVPALLRAGEVYPLVMLLHGYGDDGASVQSYFRLDELASSAGAFVVAPDGTRDADGNRFWNASPACCDFGGTDVDDVAYLGGVLDEILAGWPIDRRRVFVAGHSNGGFMSYRMACARADVVVAVAPLAGANISLDGAGCAPSRPVSVLHVHGTADELVLYDGGALDRALPAYPGAVASTRAWALADGCGATFVEPSDAPTLDLTSDLGGAETARRVATGCPSGIAVERWQIMGGSHVPELTASFGEALVDWLWSHPRP